MAVTWRVSTMLLLACGLCIGLAACGGGGGGGKGGGNSTQACALISKLDNTAAIVASADVSDPVAFKKMLETAVKEYGTTLRALRLVAPSSLGPAIDRVTADVQQERFTDARTDREPIDAYASRECGRIVNATTTSVGK